MKRRLFGLPIRRRRRVPEPPLESLGSDEFPLRQAILADWAAERGYELADVRREAGDAQQWQRLLRDALLAHVTIDYVDMRQMYRGDTLTPAQKRAMLDSRIEQSSQRLRETARDVERQRGQALH